MKIVVASDFHLDHTTHGVPRFWEIVDAFEATVDRAIEEEAAAYVFAGDLCDPDSGACVFRCVDAVERGATRLADRGIVSIWVAGNHDVIEDGTGCTTLTPMRALADSKRYGDHVFVAEVPSRVVVANQMNVIALPFTATSYAYDVEERLRELTSATVRERTVVVAHLNVPGVVPGEETTDMPRGREVWLPVDLAKERAKVVINGHYHRQHRTDSGVWIPGSLARLTFGEEGNRPGFLVVEV